MKIGLRHCLIAIALIAVGMSLLIRARRAADQVEYAGDSNLQTIGMFEAALPFALPAFLCFGLSVVCCWHGSTRMRRRQGKLDETLMRR